MLEPDTADELAVTLRRASDQRQSIVIRGAGTKMDWGRAPQRVDAILSTRRLNRLLAHAHGDLTATIEAGATLAEVNATLRCRARRRPSSSRHLTSRRSDRSCATS